MGLFGKKSPGVVLGQCPCGGWIRATEDDNPRCTGYHKHHHSLEGGFISYIKGCRREYTISLTVVDRRKEKR